MKSIIDENVKSCKECFYSRIHMLGDSDENYYTCEHPYGIERNGKHITSFFLQVESVVNQDNWKSRKCPFDKLKK